jgi:hypothetical protein
MFRVFLPNKETRMKANESTVTVFCIVYHNRSTEYIDINFSQNADVTWNENWLMPFLSLKPIPSLFCVLFSPILAFSNIYNPLGEATWHTNHKVYKNRKKIYSIQSQCPIQLKEVQELYFMDNFSIIIKIRSL